ncbi:CRAL/TRIO domain protein [Xylaria bambusicola]|uniref:CRAL/TRIO domain protein n=1 Tax=Xylaria bambusicola TaxID=326684 RepID=UPI002008C3EA|nr:CRAL/TRIO domain protein [Xylaria bambusicola]KAI0518005.1 CRAL/TRIO domain protein [Xylaria bambusicola]
MENGKTEGSTAGEPKTNETGSGELNASVAGLTEQEQESFQSFVKECREAGLLERPAGLTEEDTVDGLHDDITLLRFLSARSFDVPGALKQFKEAQAIRSSANTSEAYDSIDIDDFEYLRGIYPHWSGQRTKRGLPICLLDAASLDGQNLTKYRSYSATQNTCRAITSLDYLTRFALPLCSMMTDRPEPEKPVSGAVYLADIANASLRQAWGLRGYAQSTSALLATCYPEVVDRIYVLNAPPYFPKIWAFLKGWFDPKTADKLVIVPPADVLSTLLDVIDIECIPERYGGKSRDEHGLVPLVSGLKELLGVDELPDGPIKWTMHEGKRTAVAVGVRGGEARKESGSENKDVEKENIEKQEVDKKDVEKKDIEREDIEKNGMETEIVKADVIEVTA